MEFFPRSAVGLLFLLPALVFGDAGVLIPSGGSQPDASKLSLEEMHIDVRVDNGTARVAIRQIFANHTASVLEGQWVFALPAEAAVSDFAVWDGVTRIPGVILERRRAAELYESLKAQAIDPGLLQQGEYSEDEARRSAVFSAKVVPIPGYGFKRVEVEYYQPVTVEDLRAYFAIPLRPEAYQAQTAKTITVNLEIDSAHAITGFRSTSAAFPLAAPEQTANRVRASFSGENVAFTEDLAFEYRLDTPAPKPLEVLTYRNPAPPTPHVTAMRLDEPAGPPPGYFMARMLLEPPPAGVDAATPRTVVALFDTSLSMQWDKLDRSFQALETVLLGLRGVDRFNLVLFDSQARPFAQGLQTASLDTVEKAIAFVKQGRIRGGSNLEQAFEAALGQFRQAEGEPYLILLSDGGATQGAIRNSRLAERFTALRAALPEAQRPRVYVFGVGDDANLPLLRMLAENEGVLTHVRSTEPLDFKLRAFAGKIGRRPIENLRLEVDPASRVDMVYPLEAASFAGSFAGWVGRYLAPAAETVFRVLGRGEQGPIQAEARTALPENDQAHPQVARAWARARVDALLAKIEREGEDRDSIEEIIRWSKQFKFVTPYTSFLAAPRSLLRPRVIRPGDPVLRVRTDESITSVTALFPFGLVKQLRYLPEEDIWQTRFLAPKDTADGAHEVRLVLRDAQGRVYRESKSFLIASQPPTVKARMEKTSYRRGERVDLKVSATRTTRTLTARMYGVAPVWLRWNESEGVNTGAFVIPADLPAGEYALRLTAEDFAHNIGVEEVRLAVLP
ncbi:MAG: VWA domain-containing protein [Acidobacteria bacterium]|nr:VWA domain-containing protein [Acidobacteriota bacterium]